MQIFRMLFNVTSRLGRRPFRRLNSTQWKLDGLELYLWGIPSSGSRLTQPLKNAISYSTIREVVIIRDLFGLVMGFEIKLFPAIEDGILASAN